MSNVELIFDAHCPHVEAARQQLRQVFQKLGQPPDWQEWDRAAPSSPQHVRQYGSPTILIDGKDVIGAAPSDGAVRWSRPADWGIGLEHWAQAERNSILSAVCRGGRSSMRFN